MTIYSHRNGPINRLRLVNKLSKLRWKLRFFEKKKKTIFTFSCGNMWKSFGKFCYHMSSLKRLWLKIMRKETYEFLSRSLFYFFYPTSDEKNYANPCICPELWLYYINLSWQYSILTLAYLKFCLLGINTHLKLTQLISFLLRSLYQLLSTTELILCVLFFPILHSQIFGTWEFLSVMFLLLNSRSVVIISFYG